MNQTFPSLPATSLFHGRRRARPERVTKESRDYPVGFNSANSYVALGGARYTLAAAIHSQHIHQ